jgi:uncharacterized membrane protein
MDRCGDPGIAAWSHGVSSIPRGARKSVQDSTKKEDMRMAEITESIDVAVPVSTAYNQWTQFEEFPRFMGGVQSVQQLDDTHLRWIAEIGGKHEEWEAEITEQHPDERVAWKAIGGKANTGVVTFHRLNDEETG